MKDGMTGCIIVSAITNDFGEKTAPEMADEEKTEVFE